MKILNPCRRPTVVPKVLAKQFISDGDKLNDMSCKFHFDIVHLKETSFDQNQYESTVDEH